MSDPYSAIVPAGPEETARALFHLREQVRQLELDLIAHRTALRECQEKRALFETAAEERLAVIVRADNLLNSRRDTIETLKQELAELQEKAGILESRAQQEEGARRSAEIRLERANKEAIRSVQEIASRERALTNEILELRNEGLLHSIIRRISSLFS